MAEYIYRGNLSESPLPEILQKINYYKVPGVLTVSNSQGSRKIYVFGGEVIFASSTFDDDRLGEFLLHRKRITQEHYDRSVQLLKSGGSKKRQGALLVEIGALTPQELYRSVRDQVVAIVWSLFNWTDGEVTFQVGKFKDDEVIKLNIDTKEAILNGIKRIKDPRRIVRYLGGKDPVFELTDSALTLLPSMPLSVEDKKVLRLVDGLRNLYDIVQASSVESGMTAKILYALYVLGLIQRKAQAS